MSFRHMATGGNCSTCAFIAGDGEIARNTKEELRALLGDPKPGSLMGTTIHLNSPGGDLVGGVELGRYIRELGANTTVTVSKAAGEASSFNGLEIWTTDPDFDGDAICASACVFAFAGGHQRYARSDTPLAETSYHPVGKLGVHQFYDEASLKDPTVMYTASDRILDQVIVSYLLAYLSEVEVSAELLQLAGATRPESIHLLDDIELSRSGMDTQGSTSVDLVGYENGIAVVDVQYRFRDALVRNEFFCRQGKILMRSNITWAFYDVDAHRNWDIFENLHTRTGLRLVKLEEEFTSGADSVFGSFLFEVRGGSIKQVVSNRDWRFVDPGTRTAGELSDVLGFSIPQNFEGMNVLPHTCVS